MQNSNSKVEPTTENGNSTKPFVNRRCGGRYYNFKKGMEVCPHKDNCSYYEPDILKVNRQFASVKGFRTCSLYNVGYGQVLDAVGHFID